MKCLRFVKDEMAVIFEELKKKTKSLLPKEIIEFEVVDPDLQSEFYPGEKNSDGKRIWGYRAWVDLAELCHCRMLTPMKHTENSEMVLLRFEKLSDISFADDDAPKAEKYGTASNYNRFSKNQEPHFLQTTLDALRRIDLSGNAKILNLGINNGDEIELFKTAYPDKWKTMHIVGIDHCQSAIHQAQKRYPHANCDFRAEDINLIDFSILGRFDLIFSIGTLHSPGIENQKKKLMDLVQLCLKPHGAMILGFPNCRWIGHELLYGKRAANYNFPEQSLLYRDVDFAKRYLQQHKFRVTLTGKYYLLLTATKLGRDHEDKEMLAQ